MGFTRRILFLRTSITNPEKLICKLRKIKNYFYFEIIIFFFINKSGATQYAIQLTLIRMKLNWKFSHANVDILKITHDENEATIKIRWRVSGVGGLKRMVKLWKFDVTDIKNTIKNESK